MTSRMTPAKRAYYQVHAAVKNNILVRPDHCEVCERTANKIIDSKNRLLRDTIYAHHWRGYDYPLDVWWVCHRCNQMLERKHDGSIPTPAVARDLLYAAPARFAQQEIRRFINDPCTWDKWRQHRKDEPSCQCSQCRAS